MKPPSEIKNIAKECISIECKSIEKLIHRIDNTFVDIVETLLNSQGKIVVSGIGKSANIANKIVATFNSTGQPAVFLHASEAIHGDLGNIQREDVVICISKSGNTPEIKSLISIINKMDNILIALTGNINSYLAREADFIIDASVEKEACPNNLAPTSSTTAQLVMGDALAVSLLSCKNFSDQDFARFHPGGTLGKRLSVKLGDLLSKGESPKVGEDALISTVILEISNKRLGATVVLNENKITGIITDGDLRRMLEKNTDFINLTAKDIMSKNPKTMDVDSLAYNALMFMEKKNISQVIVLQDNSYIGIVHIHEIIKEGVV